MKLLEIYGHNVITSFSDVQPGLDEFAMECWERQIIPHDHEVMFDADYEGDCGLDDGVVNVHDSIYHWFNPCV